jgi:protein-S-isoprenylcysteine O-methyltransferase Ste14
VYQLNANTENRLSDLRYTRNMTPSIPVIAGCWAIFFVFWFVSSFFVKPTLEHATSSTAMIVRIAVLLVVFFLILGRVAVLHLPALPPTLLRSVAGDTVCVLGLLLALWARVTLGRNWSGNVTFKEGHELIRTGPYAVVRHPIYMGVLLMFIGTMIVVGRVEGIIVVVGMIPAFWMKLRAEERLMTRHFPTEYPAYKKQTKALIPFVF